MRTIPPTSPRICAGRRRLSLLEAIRRDGVRSASPITTATSPSTARSIAARSGLEAAEATRRTRLRRRRRRGRRARSSRPASPRTISPPAATTMRASRPGSSTGATSRERAAARHRLASARSSRADGGFRRRGARHHAPPRRGARAALPRHLRGRSRRRAHAASISARDLSADTGIGHAHRRALWRSPPPASASPDGLVHGRASSPGPAAPMPGIAVEIKVHRAVGGDRTSSTCGSARRSRSRSATRSASRRAATRRYRHLPRRSSPTS